MTPPITAPLVLPPSTRPTTAPTAAPAAGFAMSPALVFRPSSLVSTCSIDATTGWDSPLMVTEVGFSVRVPVLSLLFSDSLIAVTMRTTSDPAGMTTCPAASFTSVSNVAVTESPTLFLLERTSPVVDAVSDVPAASPRLAAGAGAGAGALAPAVVGRGEAAGRLGLVGGRGARARGPPAR